MSNRYKGAVISATPPTTTGGESGTASGAWTLEQQMQLKAAGLWPTQPPFPNIEDVFSTYLWTGNASTLTITNGINLSTKGGLVWIKRRDGAVSGNYLATTVDGTSNYLQSNTTGPYETSVTTRITSFNANGFSLGAAGSVNSSGALYVGWTFREQAKFFDVVTFTSAASGNTTFSHNLGSTPGCVFIKNTQTADPWIVYHRSTGDSQWLYLNTTAAAASDPNIFSATSTTFTIKSTFTYASQSYIAYLFAHDAGGFGPTGTDNVISCGSYTGDGTTDGSKLVSLGYEPQWVLVKRTDSSTNGGWHMIDVMRGMPTATTSASITALLLANTTAVEVLDSTGGPKSTGFSPVASLTNTNGASYVYLAIRRGPMAVPTDATKVFIPFAGNGVVDTGQTVTTNFPVDLSVDAAVTPSTNYGPSWIDRLRGASTSSTLSLNSSSTNADNQQAPDYYITMDSNTSIFNKSYANLGKFINWAFRRAPSFLDEVCFKSTSGFAASFTHNLGVTPELVIFKNRQTGGGSGEWLVYSAPTGNNQNLVLNTTAAAVTQTGFIQTLNSTTVLTGSTLAQANQNYVSYLFATCPGVSKVGTYTGTGATLTVDCGFTGGARFVIIKRTDSTSSWFVWDTARGMVAGTDPRLTLNTTDAQVNSNQVYTVTTGFQVVTADLSLNAIGGTYLFLAIA